MTENDYLFAWGLYALAALGCLWVGFRMTGWMWRWLREPLRVLIAVLLLTPTIIDPAKDIYAPAIAITALDLAFKVGNNVWRAVSDLAMYGMIAFAAGGPRPCPSRARRSRRPARGRGGHGRAGAEPRPLSQRAAGAAAGR